ncbi:hypothetical protein GGR50DRAFT_698992 [Xylaria sp. CBS 124048]|nr:hypothetical protein GGR50DRAFT_698992 [Xylaria sp. CBS 124048]
MSQSGLTKAKYLLVGGAAAGPKPLTFWTYNGVTLVAPGRPDNDGDSDDEVATKYNDPLRRTTFVVDALRKSKNTTHIQRLVTFKRRRDDEGNIVPVGLRITKGHQSTAIAAHICLVAVNRHGCINCAGVKGRGPFDQCVSFGDNYLHGACSCCAYNSVATSCEFHVKNKGTRYAHMTDHEAKEYDAKHASKPDLPQFTSDMMETAPLPFVNRLHQLSEYELARRSEKTMTTPSKATPKKRRH